MGEIMSISVHKSTTTGKYYLRFYESNEQGEYSDTPIELEELDRYLEKLKDILNTHVKKEKK